MSVSRRTFLKLSAAGALPSAAALADGTADPAAPLLEEAGWRPRRFDRPQNVVVVVLDDVGFADFGCYGAEHRTPCIDALAAGGVRFNNFHVTALCAPTRACLLTGRNAHAVGVGNIAEWGRDHPGYHGWIRQDARTLAEMLGPLGYSTFATGKWHLSALDDQSGAGPYDHWPVRRGFDRWYGFHGNAIDHWHPELFENTAAVYPDKSDGYHLSADLVDQSIRYVADHRTAAPDKPFFLYLAFGAMHFPLHAPMDLAATYRGAYDRGWDAVRAERFERQRQLDIVPGDARLAPRNPGVPAWAALSDAERRLTARGQEVYAAFLEHTDAQLQRFVDFLRSESLFEDTLLLVLSDNGAAPGGPIEGRLDVRRDAYLGRAPIDEFLGDIDRFGTDESYPMYSSGWSQVSNTPLKWYKSDTYEGGIRSPLVVSWPRAELPRGIVNSQYHHAIDVVPTLLEMLGETPQVRFRGAAALPVQGTSFAYTFDSPSAPTRKRRQYYETLGDRAIWADGWKAVARHEPGEPFESDTWALYHAAEDFAEVDDLAAALPDRLERLVALWHEEAGKYDVLPMSDDTLTLYQNAVPAPRATYVFYPGMTRLDRLSAPDIYAHDSRFTAELDGLARRADGVILAAGDSSCGYEWYLLDGIVRFTYVYTRNAVYRGRARRRLPRDTGAVTLAITKTGEASATAAVSADEKPLFELALPAMWPIYAANAGIRCGENRHAPISRDYRGDAVLDGLTRVVADVDLPRR